MDTIYIACCAIAIRAPRSRSVCYILVTACISLSRVEVVVNGFLMCISLCVFLFGFCYVVLSCFVLFVVV
jgi:hypothetical protein